MRISTILDQIDLGSIALPEFQRGYVWNRTQVRDFMYSLYRRFPVGSLLVWVTKTEEADTRGDPNLPYGTVELLLDGQQRITSLYGIINGRPPEFFDGNASAFTGLYFNLDEEVFEFYLQTKMKDNPAWISVSDVFREGSGKYIKRLTQDEHMNEGLETYINRLNALEGIRTVELHIEQVTGQEKTVDTVVDIFNRVNSGGTKLSQGDLALARICATWPDARAELKQRLEKWHGAGFHFKLDWLLRCVNTILTGEAKFIALKDVDASTFNEGLKRTEKAVDYLLNLISSRLGLDHERVLASRYAFPLMAHLVDRQGGKIDDPAERDRLLHWYIHTALWGRYAGSTESFLNQDLALVEELDGAVDRLLAQLRQNRGDLNIHPNDFTGWSRGARFYPLLYMLTRVWKARDWGSGLELHQHMLGSLSNLQLHHIFPKALLYKHDYKRPEVNALANFSFLTQETNLALSDREPAEYMEEIENTNPGVLATHWIPMDRELWKVENYLAFLEARQELLADAANEFLTNLVGGEIPRLADEDAVLEREIVMVPGSIDSAAEEEELLLIMEWVREHGLPEGELEYELCVEETGEPLAILDLAWPNGLQEGLSDPVALLIDEGPETKNAANAAGYLFFTNVSDFQEYAEREVLGIAEPAITM